MSLVQQLTLVRRRITQACARVGRSPDSVTLVAASKGHPPERILEALAAGQEDFGESQAQQLRDKARMLVESGPTWHFIGPLQRNKVKYVVGTATLVHAVDSEALALDIAARSQATPTRILVEVNVGREPSKHGVDPDATLELCHHLHGVAGLDLQGLMCIPPEGETPEQMRPWFQMLAGLAQQGRDAGLPLHLLSMGMSQDFEVAIEEGATHIRVGTAIFGPRDRISRSPR